MLDIQTLSLGLIGTNCHLVSDTETRNAVIVDPSGDGPVIAEAVRRGGLTVTAVWLTHAHYDHIGALADVKRAFGAPIHLHPAEWDWVTDSNKCLASLAGLRLDPQPADERLADGQVLRGADRDWTVVHVPGHSPGLCAFHCSGEKIVLGGDLLFRGSVGRVDLPGSDPRAMETSLKRALEWPDGTRILSGHGPETTMAFERRHNPYVREILATGRLDI
jgi:glyoxylase-like metal-dependent hydrolase (beta-lactamase superfamily II)